MQTAKKYLVDNPNVDVIHGTSDGNLFFNISDAKNHAKTLDDDTVETVHQQKELVQAAEIEPEHIPVSEKGLAAELVKDEPAKEVESTKVEAPAKAPAKQDKKIK